MTPQQRKKTAYEVLGVESGASQTKLKQAYIRLAQLNHPDRQGESSPAARHQAEVAMREITAAWASVSTPARRAAYDRSLRPAGSAWESQTASGATRAPRTSAVRPGQAVPPPSGSGIVVDASHARFWRWGPAVVLAFLLIGILVFTAYANQAENVDPTTTIPPGARSWEVGDCIVVASGGGRSIPILTECARSGASEVREVTDLGRPCGRGSYAYDLATEKVRLCLAE